MLLFILVAMFLVGAGIYWQSKQLKNQINHALIALENIEKDIANLNNELDRMVAESDATIQHLQHLPPPTNGVTSSYHDGGYENAWVQDIDKKSGLVLVTTKDSKISITFKPSADNLEKFHVGWIAPVTFQCTKVKKRNCDFKSPYKLFVGNGLVEVKQLKFPKK